MNKKAALAGFWFYIPTMIAFLMFPEETIGNIYVIGIYGLICLIFIYFIYFKKKSPDKNEPA